MGWAGLTQEWHSATAVAKAYSIGKLESAAVSQLMCHLDPGFLQRLTDSVKVRGMPRFLTHECIGRGIFSKAFTSGTGVTEAWSDQLVNRDDGILVSQLN